MLLSFNIGGMWQDTLQGGLKQEVKVHTYAKMWFQNTLPVTTKEVRLLMNTATPCTASSTRTVERHLDHPSNDNNGHV